MDDAMYRLQSEIEQSLEEIEGVLGGYYKLTLIAKYDGPEKGKDMDIMLTMDTRSNIETVLDRFLPKNTNQDQGPK